MTDPATEAAFTHALTQFDGQNFAQLTARDRVLVTVWGLEADVNNGGFHQYYFNSSGDQAGYAPDALRLIGAQQMADIVSRANALFGADGPSPMRETRQDQLALIAPDDDDAPWDAIDQEFYAYPDDIYALVTDFVRAAG